MTAVRNRFTTLHGEDALQATVTALEVHAFSVKVVHDLDAAREAVPARIEEGLVGDDQHPGDPPRDRDPAGVGYGGHDDSACTRMSALDFATQAQQMKAIGGQLNYALGSVHAITVGGTRRVRRPARPGRRGVRPGPGQPRGGGPDPP